MIPLIWCTCRHSYRRKCVVVLVVALKNLFAKPNINTDTGNYFYVFCLCLFWILTLNKLNDIGKYIFKGVLCPANILLDIHF